MIPKSIFQEHKYLYDNTILLFYRGSIAHGTYDPGKESIDDKDAMAVVVLPKDFYLGLNTHSFARGTKEIMTKANGITWDIVTYEVKKFIGLLLKGNPNVLSSLWLLPRNYMRITPRGQMLIDNRHLFATKQAYAPFAGYARSQFTRMRRGDKRQGHMSAKRMELFREFGYDCKNASHLVRLLRMGIEFLSTGEMIVERHDAQELLAIKKGEWSIDEVLKESERLFSLLDEALVQSSLPATPDWDTVNLLCTHIVEHEINMPKIG